MVLNYMDFNEYKNLYVKTIEDSLRFTGKKHDFFTSLKAKILKKTISRHTPASKNLQLLDIGCGHGLIHKHLKDCNLAIVGVEVANEVIQLAQEANPEVKYFTHDGKTLPFTTHEFDVAIAICVMHHVLPEQWTHFLQEMKRVLKPGGLGIIFEHNPYNPFTRYIVTNNILDKDATLLSSIKLKYLMKIAGFSHITSRYILFTPLSHRIFRLLDNVLAHIPLGAQYYTIGRV